MICPRTIRAMVSHEIAPNAPKMKTISNTGKSAGSSGLATKGPMTVLNAA